MVPSGALPNSYLVSTSSRPRLAASCWPNSNNARAAELTASQSVWLIRPCSTISLGLMGTSWSSALVVGVITFFSRRMFLVIPSGNVLPQYSRAPALYTVHSDVDVLPVMKPRHTNSTGNTSHFFMTATFGSGVPISAFLTMCFVFSIHHAEVWLSTCPLNGTLASKRSNALCLSVVTITTLSPRSYVSRTLPTRCCPMPRSVEVTQLSKAFSIASTTSWRTPWIDSTTGVKDDGAAAQRKPARRNVVHGAATAERIIIVARLPDADAPVVERRACILTTLVSERRTERGKRAMCGWSRDT
mmetsp:Transcript_29193/g.86393  ORF Transcript_29193/g.86393 Transcript_29193/m.86393 type:complete len:301 (+) Transcript_29193:2565-3467(+)